MQLPGMEWGKRTAVVTRSIIDAVRSATACEGSEGATLEDTERFFLIAEAFELGTARRVTTRLQRDPIGARLLRDREDILPLLFDRTALLTLPDDSLGREYLEFVDAEGIAPDGLIQASQPIARTFDASRDGVVAYVRRRLRDTHDLWHVVTGYRGDTLGEVELFAFTFAQLRHPGIGMLAAFFALFGLKTGPSTNHRATIARAYAQGRAAAWLPAQDWAALLPQPLDHVRSRLGLSVRPSA